MDIGIKLAQTTLLLSLCITQNVVAAQSNPASVGYVNQAIATATTSMQNYVNQAIAAIPTLTLADVNQAITTATTLTQADWEATCQSGNINSASGCYGDAGSQAFAKINRLGGNPLGYAGATGSAANSLWVRQVGAGTSCTATNNPLYILNTNSGSANSTIWICGVELTNGSPVSSAGGLGALGGNQAINPSNNNSGVAFSTMSIGNMLPAGNTQLTPNTLYFNGSTVLPTVYVFCVSTTATSVATAFAQAPATSFNGTSAC